MDFIVSHQPIWAAIVHTPMQNREAQGFFIKKHMSTSNYWNEIISQLGLPTVVISTKSRLSYANKMLILVYMREEENIIISLINMPQVYLQYPLKL